MPKARYLLVQGIAGHAIHDPYGPPLGTGSIARYVGWKFTPQTIQNAKGETVCDEVDHHLDHYTQVEQVIKDHDDLRRAIKKGGIELVEETVARSHDEAVKNFDAKRKAAKPTTHKPARAGDGGAS